MQKCGIFSTGQFGLGLVLPHFDQALSALLEDLETRGLLDQTLVVVVGEFGRSPRISTSPYPGRDRWPACYSALLAGAGVRAGLLYGARTRLEATSRIGRYLQRILVPLFSTLGMPPETQLIQAQYRCGPAPGCRSGNYLPGSSARRLVELAWRRQARNMIGSDVVPHFHG